MMRYSKDFFDIVNSGNFTGGNRASGRVTIEADWQLNTTGSGPNWGNSIRGPYRWWQNVDNDQTEIELPNVQSISWDRQLSQDLASCNITIYNQWHDALGEDGADPGVDNLPDDNDVLGKPGYFWPGHGSTTEAQSRWNQSPSTGAIDKEGNSVPGFDWQFAIVPYALLRSYEGYGGHNSDIQTAVDNEQLFLTGVWLVDSVVGGSDGMLSIACTDIGKLLLDQIIQPPTVPNALYPLEYAPDGKSAFDSYWEPKARTGVSAASQGRVPIVYYNASSTTPQYGHNHYESVDKRDDTYALSEGEISPDYQHHWWLFKVTGNNGKNIDQLEIRPWAGGYTCYVSISTDNVTWLGTETIQGTPADTPGVSEKYVAKVTIPLAIPDGKEKPIKVSIPSAYTGTDIKFIRLTFTNFYYGNFSGQTTDKYRCGLREVIAYDVKEAASIYTSDLNDLPWTWSMTSHPTRGYWVLDDSGHVYSFGDAVNHGDVTIGTSGGYLNNSMAMASTPSGNGYWVLQRNGRVTAHGDASLYATTGGQTDGQHYTSIGLDVWGAQGLQAFDIAATYTGLGYYIVFGNGRVVAFGDATSTPGMAHVSGLGTSFLRPQTQVDTFMDALPITILTPAANPLGFERSDVYTYDLCRRGTSITSHPYKLGFWVTSGSGEVSAVNLSHHGELVQRVYNPGSATSFRLGRLDFTHAIRSTESGNGYWIAFASGHIAAFGDAVGQGPSDIYAGNPALDLGIPDNEITDWSFFGSLVWGLEPDPDGSGFWVLSADGSVGAYNAEKWGQPGYFNKSGWRWFEGTYHDYRDIVIEVLLWAGFLLYDPSQSGSEDPPVFGSIESTGIPSDAVLKGDKFDKQTILDVIKELKQIVGYSFWIEWDGSVNFTTPNWWQSGNIDNSSTGYSGGRIFVDESGIQTNDPGDTLFIPEISEDLTLLNYSASLTGDALRSEIIIGNNQPDYKDPSSTGFIRFYTPTATEEIRTGVPALRNINKPAMWVQDAWENTEEMQVMAELIDMQIWFSQRTGSITTVGNPCIGINDQITVTERNTSEVFLHYLRGVNSELNNDTGEYKMTYTTNWLGSADNWAIIANESNSGIQRYTISNRVDRWQSQLGLGLPDGLSSTNDDAILMINSGFIPITVPYDPEINVAYQYTWEFDGVISASGDINDFEVKPLQFSDSLGDAVMTIYTDEATPVEIESFDLPIAGEPYYLVDNSGVLSAGDYTYTIVGTPVATGNAVLSLRMDGSNTLKQVITDSTIIVAVPKVQYVMGRGATPTVAQADGVADVSTLSAVVDVWHDIGGLTNTNTIGTVGMSIEIEVDGLTESETLGEVDLSLEVSVDGLTEAETIGTVSAS